MRVLIIEDDEKVASFISRGLREMAHVADTCSSAEDGLELALSREYDAIILDRIVGGVDGLAVVTDLRRRGNRTPVIALSGRTAVQDRIAGLDAGCDDYMTKPFRFSELLARLRALSRRNAGDDLLTLSYGGLTVDAGRRSVTRDGKRIALSHREFALLRMLMREPGRVFTRRALIERVWGADQSVGSNVVDVYVSFLRRKIDAGFERALLHTVREVGYVLRLDADEPETPAASGPGDYAADGAAA